MKAASRLVSCALAAVLACTAGARGPTISGASAPRVKRAMPPVLRKSLRVSMVGVSCFSSWSFSTNTDLHGLARTAEDW